MYYAQLNNGVVVAITETSAPINVPNAIAISQYDTSLLGCTYIEGEFIQPEPTPIPRRITVGALYDRFGLLKWNILADTSPQVQALIKDCQVRKFIDLDNPHLAAGLNMLVQVGHAIDVEAILSGEVQEYEKP